MSLNAVRLVNSILASSIHFRAQWFNEASQLISWIESIITDTFSNFDTQKFGIMNWKTSNSWICKKRMYSNLCIRKESIFAPPHGVMAQLIPNVPIPPPQYLSSTCQAMLSRGGASVRIKDHPGGGNKSYSLPSIKKKNLKTFCSNSPKKSALLYQIFYCGRAYDKKPQFWGIASCL